MTSTLSLATGDEHEEERGAHYRRHQLVLARTAEAKQRRIPEALEAILDHHPDVEKGRVLLETSWGAIDCKTWIREAESPIYYEIRLRLKKAAPTFPIVFKGRKYQNAARSYLVDGYVPQAIVGVNWETLLQHSAAEADKAMLHKITTDDRAESRLFTLTWGVDPEAPREGE